LFWVGAAGPTPVAGGPCPPGPPAHGCPLGHSARLAAIARQQHGDQQTAVLAVHERRSGRWSRPEDCPRRRVAELPAGVEHAAGNSARSPGPRPAWSGGL